MLMISSCLPQGSIFLALLKLEPLSKMDTADSSPFPRSSPQLRLSPPVADSETEAPSNLRTSPYFPTFKAPRREQILHPVLIKAYDLEPIARPEYHIRLHPVLANADLRSRYLTDPEVHVPRPLFNSSDSRRSSTSVGSSNRTSNGNCRSSTVGTSVADSIDPYSSPIAKAIIDEIDAEIAIRLNKKVRPQRNKVETEIKDGWEDDSEEKPDGREAREMQTPEMRGSSVKPEISTIQTEASSQSQMLAASRHEIAKVSISNLKELTVAEANARVQAFKASSDYQTYQSEQKRIFGSPWCANAAAKDLVAAFKREPSWTRYAADLTLILEHGDANDVAIISGLHSPLSSSLMPQGSADGVASGKPRQQRYKGPWTEMWASLGANRKEEMWD